MKTLWPRLLLVMLSLFLFLSILFSLPPHALARAGFDVKQMSDMSDFDPNNPVIPTGDTIKIGVMDIFSGSGAYPRRVDMAHHQLGGP